MNKKLREAAELAAACMAVRKLKGKPSKLERAVLQVSFVIVNVTLMIEECHAQNALWRHNGKDANP